MHVQYPYVCSKDTTHVVTRWHIPNGSDYDRAYIVTAFFTTLEDAQRYENQFSYPPEMAMLFSYNTWKKGHIDSQLRRRKRKQNLLSFGEI